MSTLSTTSGFVAAIGLLATFAGCGEKVGPMPALAPAITEATLVGPLCSDRSCKCASDVGGKRPAGEPAPGLKRYEIRVGPSSNDLRVRVGAHQIYKTAERNTECFYVDLVPGRYPVSLRAHGEPSFGAAMRISEMGGGGKLWYRSFDFVCGINVCSIDDLKAWRDYTAGLGEKHDPCGSTKVTSANYRTGRLADGLHPADLYLEAMIEVYKFVPKKPPCPAG